MLPLIKDLQQKKSTINEFIDLSLRVLHHLPNVISGIQEKGVYKIYSSNIAGTIKFVRPINKNLFIEDPTLFAQNIPQLQAITNRIKNKEVDFTESDKQLLDSFLYTIQQSIGAGLDLLVDPNSSRKHVGNRFEELMKAFFTEIGIPNKRVVLKIPYETEEGQKNYVCENDLILSKNFEEIKNKTIEEDEIVVSVKTTSKDRMAKMFIDKLLLEKFTQKKLKVIGIFLSDVQRKENNNISYTLVSGLFMVYNSFLTSLEGVYYLDPPPNVFKKPYSNYIKPFSELAMKDIHQLLSS